MDDKIKKISPSDLRLPRPAKPSDSAGPDRATLATTSSQRRPAPVESVRLIGGARRSSTEPAACPFGECDGTGYYKLAVPFGHPDFGKLFDCACRQAGAAERQRAQRRQRLASLERELGGELAGCTLDNYDLGRARDATARKTMAAALQTCHAYAAGPIGWVFLFGPTGVGKSHLAAATARAVGAQRDVTLAYAREPELLKFLRDGWGKTGDDTEDARIALLQTVDMLVLDDLGTEFRGRDGAWADAKIDAILAPRHQFERWTIITSNLRLDDIEPRIRSRIKGRAHFDYTGGRDQLLFVQNDDQRGRTTR